MNKTDYYMDACEILRFPSEIKAGISPSLFHCVSSQFQRHHNWKYHWASYNEKQVPIWNVLLAQTNVYNLLKRYSYYCIPNIKNKSRVSKRQ